MILTAIVLVYLFGLGVLVLFGLWRLGQEAPVHRHRVLATLVVEDHREQEAVGLGLRQGRRGHGHDVSPAAWPLMAAPTS